MIQDPDSPFTPLQTPTGHKYPMPAEKENIPRIDTRRQRILIITRLGWQENLPHSTMKYILFWSAEILWHSVTLKNPGQAGVLQTRWKAKNEKEDDEGDLDEQFEHLDWTKRGNKRDNEGMRESAPKVPKHHRRNSTLFYESMETLQSQGEKLRVLEAMEKNQTQQLQLINQFMNTSMQVMQSKDNQ